MIDKQVPILVGLPEELVDPSTAREAVWQAHPQRASRWLVFLDWRSPLGYLPLVAMVTLLFCGASWQLFHSTTDAARYQCYALTFWQGSAGVANLPDNQCGFLTEFGFRLTQIAPFHVLPQEYPPLTLLLFSPALLVPSAWYQVAYAGLMALMAGLIYCLLLRHGPRGAALACAAYMVLGAWGTALGRFDLAPGLLILLCVLAGKSGHWRWAYLALALAFLIKIYPLLLLPGLFLAEQTALQRLYRPERLTLRTLPRELRLALRGARGWRWSSLLLCLGLIVVVSGLFALLNVQGALVSQLSYFTNRPVQVESTGSILIWLGGLVGLPAHMGYGFGSLNVISPLDPFVAVLSTLSFVVGYLYVLGGQWSGRYALLPTFLGLTLVFIVTGKVFSPQYLMWVIPLLAFQGGFSRLWAVLWSAASLLTTLIYPFLYGLNTDQRNFLLVPGFIGGVAVRNALLMTVTLGFLFNWWQMREKRQSDSK